MLKLANEPVVYYDNALGYSLAPLLFQHDFLLKPKYSATPSTCPKPPPNVSELTLHIHNHPSNNFGRIDNVSLTIGEGAESWYGECCAELFGYLSSLWNCWCLCYVSMICMYLLWAVSKWGMMCSLFTEIDKADLLVQVKEGGGGDERIDNR